MLLGTTPFANTTNSLELALESNSFAHNISYIAMHKDYLEGHESEVVTSLKSLQIMALSV